MATADRGAPISYMVLEEGTPVFSRDGERIGEVRRVLAAPPAPPAPSLPITQVKPAGMSLPMAG